MADEPIKTDDVNPVQDAPGRSQAELYEGSAPDEERQPEPEAASPKEPDPDEPDELDEPAEPDDSPVEKHSTAAIEQAARLGIPADEIDDMSPKELSRTIAHMNRFGQHVWDNAQKQPTVPKVQDVPDEEALFTKEVEDQMLPEYTAPLKKKFAEMAKASKAKDAEIKEIKEQLQADRIERVHSRIDTLVSKLGDDLSKQLDRSTAKGSEAFKELMVTMKFVQDKGRALGKDYSEKEILERSIREMGLPGKNPEADTKDLQLKEREEEFRTGALGQPVSRKASLSAEDRLREVLKKRKMPTSKEVENSVEWRE